VKAAHILVQVPQTGGSEVEDKAKAKVADAIRRVKAGEDFAALARTVSEDTASAVKGGDLGWVLRGQTVPPFEEALFALKKGEMTPEPVRTPFGFHAILVSDIKEETKQPLAAVAGQIKVRLTGEASEKAAKAKADEVRISLLNANDFMAEAKNRGLAPAETTVARAARGGDPMEETAFALSVGGVSLPVKAQAGFVVLKAVEAIPASVPPLAEIRDRVVAAVKRTRADAQALERAKLLMTEARTGDFAAAARKAGATIGETPRFSRAKPVEKLPGDAMTAALRTPLNTVSEPVKTQQGYYVMKVLERVPPDMAGLAPERDKLSRELLAQKQSQAWETWVSGARTNAKVEVSARFQRERG
jgi:peptidyl-prolyl cis-trans isomerase D